MTVRTKTFAFWIRSRGELGELSSINQRVWREYLLLKDFLETLKKIRIIYRNQIHFGVMEFNASGIGTPNQIT